ncbi:MAG TPA: hypothetical protein VGR07_23725 [Thermoanaerobaculia bacterium]|jgi:hypothetical protein|nr:hypothetical protein [Thermoanaerobaculia bacterium]
MLRLLDRIACCLALAGLLVGPPAFATVCALDPVPAATLLLPYFEVDATDQNVLWGDYFLVDPQNNFSTGEQLVRLEAVPGRFGAGDTTFYGRTVGYSGADDREPLATEWAARYVAGGAFKGGTDLIVWRDPEQPGLVFDCAAGPKGWYPLSQTTSIFDEQEHPAQTGLPGFPPP